MKFLVRLDGSGSISGTIEIDAKTKEEAEAMAMGRSADVVWHYNKVTGVSKATALPKG